MWDEEFGVEPERSLEEDVKRLLCLIRRMIKEINPGAMLETSMDMKELRDAAEAVEMWFENDDPISMGWVGKNGLP